jgi:hypothetical protein
MTKPNRWTVDNVFATFVGLTMALLLGGACVMGQRAPKAGSELVTAAVLEKLVAKGRLCQTVTEADVFQPRRHC